MRTVSLVNKIESYRLSSDLHIHTNYVGGKHYIGECVKKAEGNGLELIAITEHVRRDLTYPFSKLLQDIYKVRERSHLHILVGAEAKVIDLNGNLDISDQVWGELDVVLGCFHSWFGVLPPTKGEYLKALLNMIKKHNVDVWAHPFLFAENYNIHLENEEVLEIIEALKKNNVFLEINLRHWCSLEPYLILFMNEKVPWVIGSDAHCIEHIWNKTKPDFIDHGSWRKLKSYG